ncbi:MAG: dTDP-glucose 4,6-dehydratase [Planctomycetes bacterium]|nr:dTDP-glucose 4,6-dehydratase [Planctomycetota bacterium]
MKNLLVTGGAGFIGSNYVRLVLDAHDDVSVVNLDALTYAGNLENLAGLEEHARYRFVRADIVDQAAMESALEGVDVDQIVHFAAESHVDRSIEDPTAFIRTNVIGTQHVIDFGRRRGIDRMVHVSTDEVYGQLGPDDPAFTEETPIQPNSPYSASKASSDLLVRAAFHTHGFPAVITRCSNNYGPYQFPEKLIPLMVTNAMEDQPLPVYGDGRNVRDWIWVGDHCRAVDAVRERGEPGRAYNIGGRSERTNLEVVKAILAALDKPESLITYVKDRPGHDLRYAIDDTVISSELDFTPSMQFEEGIERTVAWYRDHETWWRSVKSGGYLGYYERMYGDRLGQS